MADRYELVELDQSRDGARDSYASDSLVKSIARLPARPLASRRRLWPFAVVGVTAVLFMIALILLIGFLDNFEPHTPDDGNYISVGTSSNHLSCDLALRQGSSLQNAFMINLRSATTLSFGEAKLIDVIFDLFLGQGGRLVMAWAAYRVRTQ